MVMRFYLKFIAKKVVKSWFINVKFGGQKWLKLEGVKSIKKMSLLGGQNER
jgi:hypothetical protein